MMLKKILQGKRFFEGFSIYSYSNIFKMKKYYSMGFNAYNKLHYYVMN